MAIPVGQVPEGPTPSESEEEDEGTDGGGGRAPDGGGVRAPGVSIRTLHPEAADYDVNLPHLASFLT